jgi:hypothetical protein
VRDEGYFKTATQEYASGNINYDILAKARYLAEGNESRTEFKYIELRVQQMKSDKTMKYIDAAKDAGSTIAPAIGSFLWNILAIATVIGLIVWLFN